MRKPLHKAIVDEADDILLDQATRPLILSKRDEQNNENMEYADLIEYIKLDLSAKQIIGE